MLANHAPEGSPTCDRLEFQSQIFGCGQHLHAPELGVTRVAETSEIPRVETSSRCVLCTEPPDLHCLSFTLHDDYATFFSGVFPAVATLRIYENLDVH